MKAIFTFQNSKCENLLGMAIFAHYSQFFAAFFTFIFHEWVIHLRLFQTCQSSRLRSSLILRWSRLLTATHSLSYTAVLPLRWWCWLASCAANYISNTAVVCDWCILILIVLVGPCSLSWGTSRTPEGTASYQNNDGNALISNDHGATYNDTQPLENHRLMKTSSVRQMIN